MIDFKTSLKLIKDFTQTISAKFFNPRACLRPKSRTLEELLAIKPLEEWLNPISPEVSEQDHKLAIVRLAFDDNIFGWLYFMKQYIATVNDPKSSEIELSRAKKFAMDAIEEFDEWRAQRGDSDWWEGIVDKQYQVHLRESLSMPHAGDCTACPATCSRCLAEEYYKLPYTATFTKHEGYQLWQAYVKSFKKEQ